MKKLLFTFIAALLIITSCTKSNQFKVTLLLDNADNKTVYLCKDVDGKDVCIDTAVFAGKQAELKADFGDPQTLYIIKFDPSAHCDICHFFTENKNTTITGDLNEMQKWVFKGCATMDAYNAYRQEFLPLEESMLETFDASQEAFMSGDTVKAAECFAQIEKAMENYKNYRLEYIKNHGDSYMAHFMLLNDAEEFDFEKVKEVAASFTTESIYSKRVNDYINEHEKVEVGAQFIDFTLKTADGKDVNLAETIKNNKLTLVDFWASWCGPCRGENPFVKAAYEKYHAKGFEIVGVSVDQDEAAWLKAVAEDGMSWIQVRDTDNSVGKEYKVQFIPSNFLYDQNGVMLAKGLRGEDLEAKLAELLK